MSIGQAAVEASGYCRQHVGFCLVPGALYDATYRLTDPATGDPVQWPAGTSVTMTVQWGTGTELVFPGTVDGEYVRFSLSESDTEMIPRHAEMRVDVDYGDGAIPWLCGRNEGRC